MDPNDVRMCQIEATFGFPLELIERRAIANHQVGEKLQRDVPVEFFIACKPDNPHAASSEHLDQRVAAEDLLSACKLARSRGHDIACAFVTHVVEVYNIGLERKLKPRRGRSHSEFGLVGKEARVRSSLPVSSDLIHFLCVNAPSDADAWLEAINGTCYPIRGSCSVGRTSANAIVLDSPKVSRRHALIHLQNIGELWLIDYGSSNGTFLNKRRIHHPIRLADGDHITIGDQVFTFRQPIAISQEYKTEVMQRTLRQIEKVPCWLLLTDIRDFTPLSRHMQTEDLDVLLGAWIFSCKQIIENQSGTINKYLGDGFLAYWPDASTTSEQMMAVISALKELQQKDWPRFRLVIHFGPVAIGGVATMGEESLMGGEVNLIFRLERLAGSLGEVCCLSEGANEKLHALAPTRLLGEFELKGFEGKCRFFAA